MKSFFVFSYAQYYPSGGVNDLKDTFSTFDQAVAYCEGCLASELEDDIDIYEYDGSEMILRRKGYITNPHNTRKAVIAWKE